jgi:cytochrome c oxidase subunit II
MDEQSIKSLEIPGDGPWLPDAVTQAAVASEGVFDRIYFLGVATFLVIVFPMVWRVLRNWSKSSLESDASQPDDHIILQSLVLLFPILFLSGIYFVGVDGFASQRIMPVDAMEIYVEQTDQGWEWTYREDSKKIPLSTAAVVGKPVTDPSKKAHVPTVPSQRAVKLVLSAKKDTHFAIPNMRVKTDVPKGGDASVWFEADAHGDSQTYPFVAISGDSSHTGQLAITAANNFDTWVRDASGGPTIARGEGVYNKICVACHSVDGSRKVGPSFQALWGRQSQMESGAAIIVDETYFRRSMLQPNLDVVKGYAPAMPVQQLPEADIQSLMLFIQNIPASGAANQAAPKEDPTATAEPSVANGEQIYKNVCIACHSLDGSKVIGPTFKGIWGRNSVMESGKTIVVDDAYFKSSILEPMKDVVKGYPPAMPPQQFNDNQFQSLIMFVKTLK